MAASVPLHLFEAVGVELEYMIVDAQSLSVRPLSDRILRDEQGQICSEIERDRIAWSNELTHHVIELKTNGPMPDLQHLAEAFQSEVEEINRRLEAHGAALLPTAMHPWMQPAKEMELWPHDYHVVYEAFDKIFDCRGHGWANLQSMHLNLPFCGDEEFGKLHAAIRLILPILPSLAASSPIVDGKSTGHLDSRLDVYRTNSRRIPSVTGRVIPEPVFDQAAYDRDIFQPMFQDIAPYDPQGVLRNEFLNARGAIARFSRGAIEIRVIDVQECPAADLAIAALTLAVLKKLVAETWTSTAEQQSVSIDAMEPVLLANIEFAEQASIQSADYLRQFGDSGNAATSSRLWQHLYAQVGDDPDLEPHRRTIEFLLSSGSLASRILKSLAGASDASALRETYARLRDCLASGRLFA